MTMMSVWTIPLNFLVALLAPKVLHDQSGLVQIKFRVLLHIIWTALLDLSIVLLLRPQVTIVSFIRNNVPWTHRPPGGVFLGSLLASNTAGYRPLLAFKKASW